MSVILEPPVATPRVRLQMTAIEQALAANPYWSIRQLVCQIDRDRISLKGTVPSYYLKQIAQAIAAKVVGAECVCSEINVASE